MAASSGITHRISISGGEEAKRTLQEIAAAGERVGPRLRAGLASATTGSRQFDDSLVKTGVSSRQLGFAVTNLSFQVNDVATSLASGSSIFQVFAQQIGQIIQSFQQGGGAGAVIGGFGRLIAGLVTPMRLALAGGVALAAGIGLIISRAVDAQQQAREFDVILKGLGKSSQATGQQMEEVVRGLQDMGVSAEDSQKAVALALREGIKPADVQKITTAGADLNAVLGEGSMEEFIKAVAKGGAPLQEFAKRLGITSQSAKETVDGVKNLSDSISASSLKINDVLAKTARAQGDEKRRLAQEIGDLHRKKGTAEEEAALQSSRRLREINRDTAREINEIIKQRNKEAQKELEAHNRKVLESAQASVGDSSLADVIAGRVAGSARAQLGPASQAIRDLGKEWRKLIDTLAKSEVFASIVKGLSSIVTFVAKLIANESGIPAIAIAVTALLPVIALLTKAVRALVLATGPWGIVIAAVAVAILLIIENWDTIKAALEKSVPAVGKFFTDLWQSVKDGWKGVTDWFSEKWAAAKQLFSDATSAIGQFFSGQWEAVKAGWQGVLDWFSERWTALTTTFSNSITAVGQFFSNLWQPIKDGWQSVVTWFTDTWSSVTQLFNDSVTAVGNFFSGLWQSIKDGWQAVVNWFSESFNTVFGWLDNLIKKAQAAASALFGAGQASQPPATVTAASGGHVRGAGTATSDSIMAFISNGEFIVNAMSTKKWLPLLHAINRGLMPKLANGGMVQKLGVPRFALGGMSNFGPSLGSLFGDGASINRTSGSVVNRRPFSLTIGDTTFKDLSAPEKEVQRMIQVAKQKLGRRIGRKPGWYGG